MGLNVEGQSQEDTEVVVVDDDLELAVVGFHVAEHIAAAVGV